MNFYKEDKAIFKKTFSLNDQNIFAKLSGDYNAMHVDEIAARRYLFGGPVVHGIHIVLWALDKWLEKFNSPVEFSSLSACFKNALPLNEPISFRFKLDIENHVELEIYGQEQLYVVIKVEWMPLSNRKEADNFIKGFPRQGDCKVLAAKEAIGAVGKLDLYLEEETAVSLFPCLVKNLPLMQIAQLLSTTRLVGMECPGFYSVFFELDVKFNDAAILEPVLNYKVIRFNEKFSLFTIAIHGPSINGNIKAILRPAPVRQIDAAGLCKLIVSGEFKGQRAVVVGGSRGLGEIASKVLAAGGAKVLLTYFQGRDDALSVEQEIDSIGGDSESIFFDVKNVQDLPLDKFKEFSPTHLYYFATPFISGSKGKFSGRLFNNFCDYYVSGFFNTVKLLREVAPELKKVFYPSSIFVEELPFLFAEYTMAKSAGEALCLFLEKNNDVAIYKPRLPRMNTDQTASITPEAKENPAPIILKHLRIFNDYHLTHEIYSKRGKGG